MSKLFYLDPTFSVVLSLEEVPKKRRKSTKLNLKKKPLRGEKKRGIKREIVIRERSTVTPKTVPSFSKYTT